MDASARAQFFSRFLRVQQGQSRPRDRRRQWRRTASGLGMFIACRTQAEQHFLFPTTASYIGRWVEDGCRDSRVAKHIALRRLEWRKRRQRRDDNEFRELFSAGTTVRRKLSVITDAAQEGPSRLTNQGQPVYWLRSDIRLCPSNLHYRLQPGLQ